MTDTIPVTTGTQSATQVCQMALAAAWAAATTAEQPAWLAQAADSLCRDPNLLSGLDPDAAHNLLPAALSVAADTHTRAVDARDRAERAWADFAADVRARVVEVVRAGHICADGGSNALAAWGLPPLEHCYRVAVEIPAELHVTAESEDQAIDTAAQLLLDDLRTSAYLDPYDRQYTAQTCDEC
ncbi:MAG: hypothetical protein L0Y54_09160 [Sporichthyaceae bacterium]|nr:hypothetical protein [Sporichthyaceae bacterium]